MKFHQMNIKNTKVSTLLASGFAVVFVLMILLSALAISRVKSIDAIWATISDVNSVKQRHAINFRDSVHDRAIAVRDVALAVDKPAVQTEIDRITALAGHYAKSAAPMDQIFTRNLQSVSAEEKQALADIKAVEAKTQPMVARIIELRLNDNAPEAIELLRRQAAPAFVEWLASINKLIDLEEKMNQTLTAESRSIMDNFLLFIVLLCVASIVIGTAVAWFISRSLLKSLVSQVRQGTDTIATTSGQIVATGNQNLSSRTEQLAVPASSMAVRGGAVVAQVVVGTMSAINTSPKKIVEIIGVIDGIVFPNILA